MSPNQTPPATAPLASHLLPHVTVELAYSPAPRQVQTLQLRLPANACTVAHALKASGWWDTLAQEPGKPEHPVPSQAQSKAQRAAPGQAQVSQAVQEPMASSKASSTWRGLSLAVMGTRVTLQTPLADGDRLDVCRPLRVDPKLARRERFSQQGSRTSGLFARRRPGGAAGY